MYLYSLLVYVRLERKILISVLTLEEKMRQTADRVIDELNGSSGFNDYISALVNSQTVRKVYDRSMQQGPKTIKIVERMLTEVFKYGMDKFGTARYMSLGTTGFHVDLTNNPAISKSLDFLTEQLHGEHPHFSHIIGTAYMTAALESVSERGYKKMLIDTQRTNGLLNPNTELHLNTTVNHGTELKVTGNIGYTLNFNKN